MTELLATQRPDDLPQVVRGYLDDVAWLVKLLPVPAILALVDLLDTARMAGRTVLLCGNGGSGATAAHWANDLSKGAAGPCRPRLRALSLTDSMPILTALANDIQYEQVFAEQVQTWAGPGDVVICISGSGNSPNVLRAAESARCRGATPVGLIGFGGGALAALVDLAVLVDSCSMEQVEDAHMIVTHVVTLALRLRAADPPAPWPGARHGAALAEAAGVAARRPWWPVGPHQAQAPTGGPREADYEDSIFGS